VIDRLKALRTGAVDRLLPQRFVFHHVPKCGGTSVGRALRKRYVLSQGTVTPEESFRAFETFSGRTDREQMLVDVLDLREQMLLYLMHSDVRGIAAHVRFSEAAHARFANRYKFATILRDPVARFLSHYNWSHGNDGAHARIEEGFDAFLETDRARRLGATYVEYYAGLPKEADLTADEAIARAVANLTRFDIVGRLDDLEGFVRSVRKELGVTVRIGHENKARAPGGGIRKADLSPEQLDRVETLCAPDIAVWTGAGFEGTS
jgi:hypothetical protein